MLKNQKFKVVLMTILVLLTIFSLTGCNKTETISDLPQKNMEVIVYDETGKVVYEKTTTVNANKLLDALEEIEDLIIVSEDSVYGAFITSINDVKQGNNYFWNYYVNGEYATVGVSAYEVQDEDIIEFRLEKFE